MKHALIFMVLLVGCSSSAGEVVEEIPRMNLEECMDTTDGLFERHAEMQQKHFLYVYTADWCGVCRKDKPKWNDWANSNDLAITETNDGNYPIHVIDTDKVKTTRKIDYLPTYLILAQDGVELWRHEGAVDIDELDTQWKRISK